VEKVRGLKLESAWRGRTDSTWEVDSESQGGRVFEDHRKTHAFLGVFFFFVFGVCKVY